MFDYADEDLVNLQPTRQSLVTPETSTLRKLTIEERPAVSVSRLGVRKSNVMFSSLDPDDINPTYPPTDDDVFLITVRYLVPATKAAGAAMKIIADGYEYENRVAEKRLQAERAKLEKQRDDALRALDALDARTLLNKP